MFCTERSCRMIACQCAPCAGARTASAAPGACLPFRAERRGGRTAARVNVNTTDATVGATALCMQNGPRLGTPPGGNGSGVTRSPVRSRVPAPPVSFYPFTVKNTSGSRTQTGHTGHTRAHGGSHSQSVTDGDERLTLHTTKHTTISFPTHQERTHARPGETSRPQTVPRSHCPEPTRPQRTRTSARERARRDAPEPTVETEPAEPTEPPAARTLFR